MVKWLRFLHNDYLVALFGIMWKAFAPGAGVGPPKMLQRKNQPIRGCIGKAWWADTA